MKITFQPSRLVLAAVLLSMLGTAFAVTPKDKNHSPGPPKSSIIANGVNKDAMTYVEAEETGYLKLDRSKPIKSKYIQFLALKVPTARINRIVTAKEWETFTKQFAGIEIGTGKQLSYKPDFAKEQVLVLFAGPQFRVDTFMDIEIYSEKNTLKGFVFHGLGSGKDPIAISKAADQPFHGTFYLAAIPKRFKQHTLEFRMAYQSWGRVCSKFSPLIKDGLVESKAATPYLHKGPAPKP